MTECLHADINIEFERVDEKTTQEFLKFLELLNSLVDQNFDNKVGSTVHGKKI